MTIAAKQWVVSKAGTGYMLLVLLFLIAAVGLNYTRLPLFFSVEFIFGSAVAVLALLVLGRVAAIIAGGAAAAVTLAIWGHPYALLVFTAEIIWLSWRWRPRTAGTILCWRPLASPSAGLFLPLVRPGLPTLPQVIFLLKL